MPAAIPFIIQAVGTLFAVSSVTVAFATIVASALISNYQKRKQQRASRAAYNDSLEDRLVSIATANAPRSFVYGRTRNVDGIIFKGTWGPNSENYTMVTAIAGHAIDGVERLYFNDIAVDLISDGQSVSGGASGGVGYYVNTAPFLQVTARSDSAIMTVTGGTGAVVLPHTPIAGSVTLVFQDPEQGQGQTPTVVGNTVSIAGATANGNYTVTYQWNESLYRARVWIYNGDPGQTLYPLLSTRFPTLLNANDKFSGIAIVVVEFSYDQDAFAQGIPGISAVMRGAKVLDTRTGLTVWTENPSMIARDWALRPNGGNCTLADIDEASFIAAANACDVSTAFNLANGSTEVRPLYQCGIVCSTDVNADDNFGEIVESMAGDWAFSGGKIKVVAGVARAAIAAIDNAWLSDGGPVMFVKDTPKSDLVNCFKPVISNADGFTGPGGPATPVAYTATPMPLVRSEAFIAADGQELIRENAMLGVTRNVHAQHICSVLMRRMRDGMLVTMTCNMRAWTLEVFDVVTLTLPIFGITNKLFEVIGWKFTLTGGIELTLRETDPSIYQVNGSLSVLNASPNTTLPLPWVVEQITGVTVVSDSPTLEDGWPITRTRVSWNQATTESVRQSGQIEVQYLEVASVGSWPTDDWPGQMVSGDTTQVIIPGLKAGTSYAFRVRAQNTIGIRGKWSLMNVNGITAPPLIDTPIIEEEATSVVLSSASVSGSVTNVISYGIVGVSWLNDSPEDYAVRCEWAVLLSASAGINARGLFLVQNSPNGSPGTPVSYLSEIVSTTPTQLAGVQQFVVVSGGSFTASVFAQVTTSSPAPGYGMTWESAVVRFEAVKR